MRLLSCVAIVVVGTPCLGQVFQGLGVVPGQKSSQSFAISSDGTTIVGSSQQFGGVAWRWTVTSGRVDLGSAPVGYQMLQANDVSGDGSVIVGSMQSSNNTFAWRWTQTTGIERVVGVGATFGPYISSDASTIVGQAENGGAVRWTQSTGVQLLGPVTGLPFVNGGTNMAFAASADGSTIVGVGTGLYQLNPPRSTFMPFRWTQPSGSVALLDSGQFYNLPFGAGATSVSDDGTRVVGYADFTAWLSILGGAYQAIVFNPPVIPGTFSPSISGDGMTVAYREFLWTQSNGTQLLTDVLTTAGCNFSGWSDLRVIDTSFNGCILCGYGTNPVGQTEAWYATIPSPNMLGMCLGCGGIAVFRARRRRISILAS